MQGFSGNFSRAIFYHTEAGHLQRLNIKRLPELNGKISF
jgi:hypothetical protein